jgi:uncharacterized protein YndB with AHSA1/START domain
MIAMDQPAHSVTVSGIIGASAEALYAAWTDPSAMSRWMGKAQADARVGGRYRIEHEAGGRLYVHKGEYRVLEAARRIVQTFAAGPAEREPASYAAANDEYVEVLFKPLEDGSTEVTLINGWNGGKLDPDGMEAIEQAWSHWLTLLDRHIAGPSGSGG